MSAFRDYVDDICYVEELHQKRFEAERNGNYEEANKIFKELELMALKLD